MERLEDKVTKYVAFLYKKWNDCGLFREYVDHCENYHQYDKWWHEEFLDRLPTEDSDTDSDENSQECDDYCDITKLYTVEQFFENDLDLFSQCIRFVHNYYTEEENTSTYPFDEPYQRTYVPERIMCEYSTIYLTNNKELMRNYIPERLLVDMDKTIKTPNPA
jgi:hypothetical protein